MHFTNVLPHLYLIDLEQKKTGFRNFISSWLFMNENTTFLIDPGPKYSIETLINALKEIGVVSIDYILLTHIHIDHAGAAGRLLEIFPQANIICHPKGIEHMVEPEKLWKGSLKVLGEIAEAYGKIIPIPADKISFQEEIKTGSGVIKVVETPGHAVHHISFLFNQTLFVGEAAGVNHHVNNTNYMRPATPPKFIMDISLASLDKVIDLNPDIICFGHHGYRKDSMVAMQQARKQMILWVEEVKGQLSLGEDNFTQRVFNTLLEKDPVFANFKHLDPDIQKREEYFVGNSIKGIKDFLSK